MIRRRWRLLLVLGLLLLLGGLALVPSVRWPVYGWLRGEAFFKGMPTSYWRGIGDCVRWHMLTEADPGASWRQAQGWVGLQPRVAWDFRADPGTEDERVPVLLELLEDDDPLVLYMAVGELRRLGKRGQVAVPSLLRLYSSDKAHRTVVLSRLDLGPLGDSLRDALLELDPEAAARAGIR